MTKLVPSVQHTLSSETLYQLVMVTALLELLLLGALLPRTPNAGAPVCFAAVSGLRLAALLALAGLLASQRNPVRPLGALIALSIWGAMLAPPELWAAAIELRVGLPLTIISSIALSGGLYAALRVHRAIGWGFLTLICAALLMQNWQLEPLGMPLGAVIALGTGLWVLSFHGNGVQADRVQSIQGEPE